MNENIFHSEDISLNYAEGPENGPPMLLVHGNMGRWQAFLPIIPELITRVF